MPARPAVVSFGPTEDRPIIRMVPVCVKEVYEMDRETQHEFDRLLRGFDDALLEVRAAPDDDHALRAWKHIQMLSHELNALLPAVEVHTLTNV